MNHYDALGVPRDASPEDIKRAYRKKAQKAHPDKPGGDVVVYQQIQRAHDVLMDEARRKQYDQTGDDRQGPTMRERALQTLCTLLMQTIMNEKVDLDTFDVVGHVRQSIVKAQESLPERRKQGERAIRRMQAALKRLKGKHRESRDLMMMIEAQIRAANEGFTKLEEDKELGVEMLAILRDYQYQHDAPREQSTSTTYGDLYSIFSGLGR